MLFVSSFFQQFLYTSGATQSPAERKRLIELYEKGLKQLKSGIQLHVMTLDDNQKAKAEDIQNKMRTNMEYVEEQLTELSKKRLLQTNKVKLFS